MKNRLTRIIALLLVCAIGIGLVGCKPDKKDDGVIYVGNTAATTGSGASIGVPFNLGLQAAFSVYNAKGGFNGRQVALKHYDDEGDGAKAYTLMEKLVMEDEIFAVVGNYGSYAVASNLEFLKENNVPMVYAAAGNKILLNENATTEGEKGIFPVQPLNYTEGQMLILRAFAPMFAEDGVTPIGGLGGSKVAVIANSDEASQGILEGIRAEAEASDLDNITELIVQTDDYSGAANAVAGAGCDVVIVTVNGTPFMSALTALANVNYRGIVLTSYNNSSAAIFNDSASQMTEVAKDIFSKMVIYAQGWLDITDLEYYYKDENSSLYKTYKFLKLTTTDAEGNELGVPGFNKEYWEVANNIYDYAASQNNKEAFNLSYNSYALAGYIAGDLFCKALEKMQEQGMELTRSNLIAVMEANDFQVCMSDTISYKNGYRSGVESFALTMFYDANNVTQNGKHTATSVTVHPLTVVSEIRKLISGK